MSFSRCSPRSLSGSSSPASSVVARVTITCPPWAALMTRAARCTSSRRTGRPPSLARRYVDRYGRGSAPRASRARPTPLACRGCLNGVTGAREHEEEAVALHLDLDPAVEHEGLTQDLSVDRQRVDVAHAPEVLEQSRRSFDVGEQQGDGAGRKISHGRARVLACSEALGRARRHRRPLVREQISGDDGGPSVPA